MHRLALTCLTLAILSAGLLGQAGLVIDPAPVPDTPASAPATSPTTSPTTEPTAFMMDAYEEMITLFKLTPQQVRALKDAVGAKQVALTKYMADNGDAWRKAGLLPEDETARKEALAKVDALQQGFDKIVAQQEAKIASILTAQQQKEWMEHVLTRDVLPRFTRTVVGHDPSGQMAATSTPPSDDQMKVIRKACADAAKTLMESPSPYDLNARRQAVEKIVKQVKEELPSAPQPGGAPTE